MDITSYLLGKKKGGNVNLEQLTATENDTYIPDTGYAGFSSVTVNVQPTTQSKTVALDMASGNQVVEPDTGNLLTGVTVTKPETLIAENIKKDVVIGGVTGTLESGGGASGTDVIFIDYDGTVVASYSAEDFLALNAMPENPSHEGLTAQGWNWTLADAKEYVEDCGMLCIGQMYVTTSGDTEIDLLVTGNQNANCGLQANLYVALNGTATVDWGDGNTKTISGSSLSNIIITAHTYSAIGSYTFKLKITSGSGALLASSGSILERAARAIKAVRIGSGIVSLGDYAFNDCLAMETITIPSSVESFGSYTLSNCYSLKAITIPAGITSVGQYAFSTDRVLKYVAVPKTISLIPDYAFSNCYALRTIVAGGIGNYAAQVGYSLEKAVIYGDVGNHAFHQCFALNNIKFLEGVTAIGNYAFRECSSLKDVELPDGVTAIGTAAFTNCVSLRSIKIPSTITSIDNDVFYQCYSLASVRIEAETPPTLAGTGAFYRYVGKFYIPSGSLSAYESATNWSSFAGRYIEY